MAKTVTKGQIGKEDLNYGTGTFARTKSDGTSQNIQNIPLDSTGLDNDNLIPVTSGNDLGSTTLRWDAFLDTVTTGVLNNVRAVTPSGKFTTIQAAITDLGASPGIVDARGSGNLSISGTVTIPAKVTVLLGTYTYTGDTLPVFQVNNGASLIGSGMGFSNTDAATRIVTNLTGGSIIKPQTTTSTTDMVTVRDFQIDNTSSANAGAIGIDMIASAFWTVERIRLNRINKAIRIGGNTICSCYNHFYSIQVVDAVIGAHFSTTANQNTWLGGQVQPFGTGGTAFLLDSTQTANSFYHPSVENFAGGFGFDVVAGTTNIYDPYFETGGTAIRLGTGASGVRAFVANIFDGGGLTAQFSGIDAQGAADQNLLLLDKTGKSTPRLTASIFRFRSVPEGAVEGYLDSGTGGRIDLKDSGNILRLAFDTDESRISFTDSSGTGIGGLFRSAGNRVATFNTKFEFQGGVYNDASGFKHTRVTTGSISASSSALVTVTWSTAFADANYTVTCSVLETTASRTLQVDKIESQTSSAITVRVFNNDAGSARTGTLNVIAVHD